MTVTIKASQPGGDIRALAEACVKDELAAVAKGSGTQFYDSELRQRAIDCIVDYYPAYVVLAADNNLASLSASWAMGGKTGTNLDPVTELRGLRQVASHIMALWPKDGRDRIIRMLRNVKPINAMALLDRELLIEERALQGEDTDWSDEASQRRADAYKAEQAKKLINQSAT